MICADVYPITFQARAHLWIISHLVSILCSRQKITLRKPKITNGTSHEFVGHRF